MGSKAEPYEIPPERAKETENWPVGKGKMNESLILILYMEKFSCMSNSINSLSTVKEAKGYDLFLRLSNIEVAS